MKEYYAEFSNGDCEFFKARNDCSAYKKACKEAKKLWTELIGLQEFFEDDEVGRVIEI